jgi:hypothetical protein
MLTTSDSTVYGFLKRGSYRPAAESGYSLSEDWPQADHHEPATQLGQRSRRSTHPTPLVFSYSGPAMRTVFHGVLTRRTHPLLTTA